MEIMLISYFLNNEGGGHKPGSVYVIIPLRKQLPVFFSSRPKQEALETSP